jgi:hypothetical protein
MPWRTTLISGGHDVAGLNPQDLRIYTSKPNGANGWQLTAENVGSNASVSYLKVTAICIK